MVGDDAAMRLFGNDALDAIALAEDEARMLGAVSVEPEHLLLAILRRIPFDDALSGRVTATDVYRAIVDRDGLGDGLVLGQVPRSRAVDLVLGEAIEIARRRHAHTADSVHLLLALLADKGVATILEKFGVGDVAALVDEHSTTRDRPMSEERARVQLVSVALGEGRSQLYPAVPVFERFTSDARRAVRAAVETAASLEHREVEPFHFLIGCAGS
jgi:hypothetical protein